MAHVSKAVGFVQALEGRLAEEVVAEVVSEGKALLEKGTGSQGCLEEQPHTHPLSSRQRTRAREVGTSQSLV